MSSIFLGHEPLWETLFNILRYIPMEALKHALEVLEHSEATGPLLNPSAWMGKRFEAAQGGKELICKVIELTELQNKWLEKVEKDEGLKTELEKGVVNG